ncbi:hypothetical protein BaRGS_00021902 [Batillaria attramentaria]|uniref:Uncharacterized protein n=1 Tax=Batillaria attramentaria TaxID=370345 RepID=A0ABD0KIN3_9CAEN
MTLSSVSNWTGPERHSVRYPTGPDQNYTQFGIQLDRTRTTLSAVSSWTGPERHSVRYPNWTGPERHSDAVSTGPDQNDTQCGIQLDRTRTTLSAVSNWTGPERHSVRYPTGPDQNDTQCSIKLDFFVQGCLQRLSAPLPVAALFLHQN